MYYIIIKELQAKYFSNLTALLANLVLPKKNTKFDFHFNIIEGG